MINSKKQQQIQEHMSQLNQKVFTSKQLKENVSDTHAKVSWVYGSAFKAGFRCSDVKRSMVYLPPSARSVSSRLVYFTACIVVIYSPELNKQQHYLQHTSQILAIASGRALIATGEQCQEPAIHIWDPDSLCTLGLIKGTL